MPYISADGTVGGKPTIMAQVFGFFAGKSLSFFHDWRPPPRLCESSACLVKNYAICLNNGGV